MRLAYKLSFLVFAAAIISAGCSDRGDTITPVEYDTSSQVYTIGHECIDELMFTMYPEIRADLKIYGKVYTPPGHSNPGQGRPYPVLILLSPYNETDEFYFNHGLKDVADRLISEGKIEPMIIVCINGHNSYGGTFYADAFASGRYSTALGEIQGVVNTGTMIDYIDGVFNTISDARHGAGMGRKNRAVSGVGVGGYGAMRLAVTHSENFSSVSAVSAPLDFDGANGSGGFVPLFEVVINTLDISVPGGLDSAYKNMDTSYTRPVRNLIFAAATNFSPHDTAYVNPRFRPYGPGQLKEPDGIVEADDTLRITDEVTYLKPYGADRPFKFHLPFDKTGEPYNPVWQLWLDNNIPNLMAAHPGALDMTAVMLLTSNSPDMVYEFDQQTLDFAAYLTGQGIAYNDTVFAGYPGFPANGNAILYDILGKILEFHSRNFETPEF